MNLLCEAFDKYSQYISPEGNLKFFQVSCAREYGEILSLRTKAYAVARKIHAMATTAEMADECDSQSIIIGVKEHNILIGSIRVTVLTEQDKQSLTCQYYENLSEHPNIEDLAKGSRLCILPSASGRGLALMLEVLMVLTAHHLGKRYLLGAAEGTLINFHKRCGFKSLGKFYVDKQLNNISHELLIMDIPAVLKGYNVEPRIWENYYLPGVKIFNIQQLEDKNILL